MGVGVKGWCWGEGEGVVLGWGGGEGVVLGWG